MITTKLEAVVHVCWELPFPLRLAPHAILVWEPEQGVAVFDPRPRIGELAWHRSSNVLPTERLYPDSGPNQVFPEHEYLLTSALRSGQEIPTAKLTAGPSGGFIEPRAYTVANFLLCVRDKSRYNDPVVLERAGRALNNVIDLYRFVTMDPLVRSLRVDLDSYYTLISVADIPNELQELPPKAVLEKIEELKFGSLIGVNRAHKIGLNSLDDIYPGPAFPDSYLQIFLQLVRSPHELELFHQLIFSAVRRLKRHEEALAVLDAQSSVETLVALVVREELRRQGLQPAQIDTQLAFGGTLHTLQRRLEWLDRIAPKTVLHHPNATAFLGSLAEQRWRNELYFLRNRIVHEGLRSVSFESAKNAIVAGLHAIHAIQNIHPSFKRQLQWSGSGRCPKNS